METIKYEICETCAPAVAYGETEDADVIQFIEDHGLLAFVGTEDAHGGYWDCEACKMTTLGESHVFEMIG